MWLCRTCGATAQHHPCDRQRRCPQRQQPPHQRVHPDRVRVAGKREVPRSRCRVRLPLAHQPVLLGTSTAQNLSSRTRRVNAVAGIAHRGCGSSWGNRGDRPRPYCGCTVHSAVDGSGDDADCRDGQRVSGSPACGGKKVRGVRPLVTSASLERPRQPRRAHSCRGPRGARQPGTTADPGIRR